MGEGGLALEVSWVPAYCSPWNSPSKFEPDDDAAPLTPALAAGPLSWCSPC